MAEPVNQHQILEESRAAAVQTLANIFEGLNKVRKLRRRTIASFDDDKRRVDADDAPENGSNDFLFDLLKLNATYMNEVARLGKSYKDLALRALENMYQFAHPRLKNQSGDEVVFSEKQLPRKIVVQNDLDPEIEFAILDVPKDVFEFDSKAALAVHKDRVEVTNKIAFGTPQVLTLTAKLDAFKGRKREDYIYIILRHPSGKPVRERRIPIVLDGRAGK